jgi:hypothetical protein
MKVIEAQQVLDTLEKLANETPTTHVRVGKAISEGKEHVALWFDDSTDPLQQALYLNATKPEKLKPLLTFFRTRLSAPEPEPVAWLNKTKHGTWSADAFKCEGDEPSEPLYTAPVQRERVQFPTMLRRMWSGSEVQAWLDENVNKEKNNG